MSWRLTVLALCTQLAAGGSAFAQAYGEPPLPLGEVSGGYLFAQHVGNENDSNGWQASVAFNLNQSFGIAGEISGTYDRTRFDSPSHTISRYAYVGGPRLFWKRGHVVPYAQLLVGGLLNAHPFGFNETGFAIQPGGGLTVLATEHLGIRVAGDYQRAIFVDDAGSEGRVRFGGGLVFGWGAR